MRWSGLTGVVVAAVCVAECARSRRPEAQDAAKAPPPPPSESVSAPTASTTDSARALYWSFVRGLGDSRTGYIKVLGKPNAVQSDTLRNQYDSLVVDSVVLFSYTGLQAHFFVGAGGNEFPIFVSVTDSTIKLPLPVGIGSTRSDLERQFGRPDAEATRGDSTALHFNAAGEGGGDEFVFILVRNVVMRVDWHYYFD